MAYAAVRAELKCSVCLNIYTDPVNLRCGHNYCRACIDRVLDTQEGSGSYSCPQCRKRFRTRPALHRNISLRNILEYVLSVQPDQEESGVFCTYCVDSPVPAVRSPVPAVRSCLLCEVSLCDKHLRVHKKSPEHVFTDPTSSMESRQCSIHKEVLKYFCIEDYSRVCASCCLIGEHAGHKIKPLDKATEKKEKLRNILQKLLTKREERCFYTQEAADIVLDVNTAHNKLQISDDGKTASRSDIDQNRPETPERFHGYRQVLSSQSFSSGRHYWEVDVGRSESWTVGMCYPSIDRKGWRTEIGGNNKSWGLIRIGNQYGVIHDNKRIFVSDNLSSNRVRIDVNYEAGRISFYDVCNPIRLLNTFATTFTEPIHAALCVVGGCIKICGGNREM